MKIAVKATEVLTKTVIVDCDNYEQAKNIVIEAYNNGDLIFNEDNSSVKILCENDTDNYIEIFGKEDFESMDSSF